MIEDEWIIKKVKYDGTVSIVFTMELWDGDEHVD